jgi:glycosyltransferase involved in cell wall biosynthesis
MLKTTCLVNNYNYSNFVVEAVESVLNQTTPFDEIIIVDDCSTDNSVGIIQEKFHDYPQIKMLFKDINEGQLSAFNHGYAAASGDVICFLDSDDIYQSHYLQTILKVYNQHPECDFLYCKFQKFETLDSNDIKLQEVDDISTKIVNNGYSVVITLFTKIFIGSATSTISMRRKILDKVLPIPYLEDWRCRADECLMYGASIVGANKFNLQLKLVNYRVHGNNNFYGQSGKNAQEDLRKFYQHSLALDRLLNWLSQKMNYPEKNDLAYLVAYEFKSGSQPNNKTFWIYLKILWASTLGFSAKIKGSLIMLKHLIQNKSS